MKWLKDQRSVLKVANILKKLIDVNHKSPEEGRVFGKNSGNKMVVKNFTDTNIIVHYFLLSTIYKSKKSKKEQKLLWREYRKIKPSYDLMLKILSSDTKDTKFITSPLAFSEIFYAIYEEYICRKMLRDGIPLSSWSNLKNRFSKLMKEADTREIYRDIKNFREDIEKKIKIVDEVYDFRLIQKLVLKCNLRTHDAVLFSTAKNKKCSFFITKDGHFLDNKELKKYKKIKIIPPEEAALMLK